MVDIASVFGKTVKSPEWAFTLGTSVRSFLIHSEFKRIAQKIKEIEGLDDYLSSGSSMGRPSEWDIKAIDQTLMDNVDGILSVLNDLKEERRGIELEDTKQEIEQHRQKLMKQNERVAQLNEEDIRNYRRLLELYRKGEEKSAAEILRQLKERMDRLWQDIQALTAKVTQLKEGIQTKLTNVTQGIDNVVVKYGKVLPPEATARLIQAKQKIQSVHDAYRTEGVVDKAAQQKKLKSAAADLQSVVDDPETRLRLNEQQMAELQEEIDKLREEIRSIGDDADEVDRLSEELRRKKAEFKRLDQDTRRLEQKMEEQQAKILTTAQAMVSKGVVSSVSEQRGRIINGAELMATKEQAQKVREEILQMEAIRSSPTLSLADREQIDKSIEEKNRALKAFSKTIGESEEIWQRESSHQEYNSQSTAEVVIETKEVVSSIPEQRGRTIDDAELIATKEQAQKVREEILQMEAIRSSPTLSLADREQINKSIEEKNRALKAFSKTIGKSEERQQTGIGTKEKTDLEEDKVSGKLEM